MKLFLRYGPVFFGLFFSLSFSPSTVAKEQLTAKGWTPTSDLIEEVEAELKMPVGTALRSYARYYYGQYSYGHRMLIGEFALDPDNPGAHIVAPEQAPKILDGGCALIDLKYDVEKKVVVDLSCSGTG